MGTICFTLRNVPAGCKLILGGGFVCKEKTTSSSRKKVLALTCDHEEADIRIIRHGLEATKRGYDHIMAFCRDTDVLLLLLHFFGGTEHIVWMIGGTARERRCYPVHTIYKNLLQDVHKNNLGFHALTGSDTTSSFAGFGKKSCWKMFIQHPLLLDGVGPDDPFEPVKEFICYLYMAPDVKGGVNKARADIFRKRKKELDHLPLTYDALQLHTMRAKYQSKVWLHADKQCIQSFAGSPESSGGWLSMGIGLAVAFNITCSSKGMSWTNSMWLPDKI